MQRLFLFLFLCSCAFGGAATKLSLSLMPLDEKAQDKRPFQGQKFHHLSFLSPTLTPHTGRHLPIYAPWLDKTFFLVSANRLFQEKEEECTLLYECEGIKVGVFALFPVKGEKSTIPYLPMFFSIEQVLKKFSSSKVDMVILLSLLTLEEDREIIKNFPKIDVILGYHDAPITIGYHEHTYLYKIPIKEAKMHFVDLILEQKVQPQREKEIKIYPSPRLLYFDEKKKENFQKILSR